MTTEKYKQNIERCKVIGRLLSNRFENIVDDKFNRDKLVVIYSEITGLNISSSYQDVLKNLRDGPSPQQISSSNGIRGIKSLDRLAIFYQLLGVPEDSEEVRLVREINHDFVYSLLM